jgi:hypothetical protein
MLKSFLLLHPAQVSAMHMPLKHASYMPLSKDAAPAIPSLLIQPLVVQSHARLASRWRRRTRCRARRAVAKQAAAHGAARIAQTPSCRAVERLLEQRAASASVGRKGRVGRGQGKAVARAA